METPPQLMKPVYGYVRVSTVEQSENGDSIETQTKKIEEYCKYNKLDLLKTFVDGGISGCIEPSKRPQMKLLLLNLEAQNAKGLVVCKIDRLNRSAKDFMNLISDFKDKGINLYCISPDINQDTTTGKFSMQLLSLVGELELNLTKDRVKEVILMKKNKGERVGTIPFGKRLIPDTKLLEDHPDEQKTILIVKELREQKKLVNNRMKSTTYQEICKQLESQKRLNKHGISKFSPSQIRRMLNDGDYKSGRKKKAISAK